MPSRPPLLSEIKPSTSGIIEDPHTGDRKVAPTKRPDGTLRKEIKIRPGFTPQEDVSKFRSARQNEFHSGQLPKGSVVGFIRPQEAVVQATLKGMTEAQKKNAKRKEKRKAATTKSDTDVIPDQWDRSSTGSNPQGHQAETTAASVNSDPAMQPEANPNPGKTLFQSALKSTSSNPATPPQQHLITPTNPPEELISHSLAVKRAQKEKEGVKLFATAMQSINDNKAAATDESADSVEKRARAMRKKLTQAQQLKTRHDKGEILLAEQMDKISKIDELQNELKSLQLT